MSFGLSSIPHRFRPASHFDPYRYRWRSMIGHTDGSVLNNDSERPGRGSRTPAARARSSSSRPAAVGSAAGRPGWTPTRSDKSIGSGSKHGPALPGPASARRRRSSTGTRALARRCVTRGQYSESLPVFLPCPVRVHPPCPVRVHPGRPAANPTAVGWDAEQRARAASVRLPRKGRSELSFRTDPSVCPIMLRHRCR